MNVSPQVIKPKVSVIIPVYKVEEYIERCARSLFEQTLDEIEFLFVDDCTPDKSIEVLNRVLKDYPRRKQQVVIHRMENNSGQAAVRKWGMQNATGEFVTHCDSDDWVDRDIYEQLYITAVKNDADIVYYDYYISDGNKHTTSHRLKESFNDKYDVLRLLLSTRLTGSVCCSFFRRSLYKDNFTYPTADMGEDLAMMVQMVYNSSKNITYLPQPLYYYRTNMNSISNQATEANILRKLNDNIINGDQMFTFLQNMGLADEMPHEIELYKFMVRKNLLSLLGKKGYYNKWDSCYPEINRHFLFNKVASMHDKLLFMICRFRCYHLLSLLNNRKSK